MKIQNRLAGIAEGLYFINHIYEKDLATAVALFYQMSSAASYEAAFKRFEILNSRNTGLSYCLRFMDVPHASQ